MRWVKLVEVMYVPYTPPPLGSGAVTSAELGMLGGECLSMCSGMCSVNIADSNP